MNNLAIVTLSPLHCKEPTPKTGNKYSQKRNCAATVPILPILLQQICGPILGIYKLFTYTKNVEIVTEAAQFLDQEYVNGLFVAVRVGTQQSGAKSHGLRNPRHNV